MCSHILYFLSTCKVPALAGVGFGHLTGEVKKMLGKIVSIDQDNFPEMLGHTCIINAGSVVSLLFRFVKPMLDLRTQNKIEVLLLLSWPSQLHHQALRPRCSTSTNQSEIDQISTLGKCYQSST